MSKYRRMVVSTALAGAAALGAAGGAQAQPVPPSDGDVASTLSSLASKAQMQATQNGNGAFWTCAGTVLKEDGRFGVGAHISAVNPKGDMGTQVGGGTYVRVAFDPAQTKDFGSISASYDGFYVGINDKGVATASASTDTARYERVLPATSNASGINGDTVPVKEAVSKLASTIKTKCSP